MRCPLHPRKRRYATGAEAEQAAASTGYRYHPCVDCGGFHLTSDERERVTLLSSAEQAVLIVAREPTGAEVDPQGNCLDGEGRHVTGPDAVRSLVAKRMIRVEDWGEIVPRKAS